MTAAAIRCEGLGKRYRIGERAPYRTLRDAIANAVSGAARWRAAAATPPPATIWALRNVSFEVSPGEVVGVIGRNGAGKSTLLKILSRITRPTEGRARIRGRVDALLEVGTGFHPELTGRENIFLNGAILGMTREQIRRRFDAIAAFAEVERFLDTPVKRYSSGMYMRLAFAVAAHLEPDILIIDEVLAVGDAAFQKKCLGKIDEVARGGRTALFVSHNMVAVQSLCERAIWLDEGRIMAAGPTGEVVRRYLQSSSAAVREQTWEDSRTAPGNEKVRLHRVAATVDEGGVGDTITVRTPIALEFEFWNLEPGACLGVGAHLYDEDGVMVFESSGPGERPLPVGRYRSVCRIPGDLLNDGKHSVVVNVIEDESRLVYRLDHALVFDVHDVADLRGSWFGRWMGVVRPNLQWTIELVESKPPATA
jgi:lipopolysaccharide transport system ATP-binding protein